MGVDEVVKWLTATLGETSQAGVVVLSRLNDPATGVRAAPPVIDISFDVADREVHLLLNHRPDETPSTQPLTVASFLARLRDLPPSSGTFHFFSGTWHELPDGYSMRVDWPFDGITTKEDNSSVAFVERALVDETE